MTLAARVCSSIAALTAITIGCAAFPDASAPGTAGRDHESSIAKALERIGALETRVEALQLALAEQRRAHVITWSCMAKCGARSTQTTEFVVNFHEVTGHGDSAAAAYEDLLGHCAHAQIYQRIEGHDLIEGEMWRVCLRDFER